MLLVSLPSENPSHSARFAILVGEIEVVNLVQSFQKSHKPCPEELAVNFVVDGAILTEKPGKITQASVLKH